MSGFADRILRRLSRVTSSGRAFLPQIDGMRFVAITWVFGTHSVEQFMILAHVPSEERTTNPVLAPFAQGPVGVSLFFAISGFILALPFARHYLNKAEPVALRTYFVRRLTRLEPPYLVHLAVLFFATAILPDFIVTNLPKDHFGWAVSHIFPSLFYSHQLLYGAKPQPNTVLWSLEVEVQFYILAPLLARVFAIRGKHARRVVVGLAVLLWSGALQVPGVQDMFFVTHSLLGKLHFFLVGFLLLDLFLVDWAAKAEPRRRFDLLSGVAWVGVALLPLDGMLLPWMILVAYVGAFRGVVIRAVLSNRWITTIGGMCYTIYMYHKFMIQHVFSRITMGKGLETGWIIIDFPIQFLLWACMTLVVCGVLFVLFERPFMRQDWPERLRQFIGNMWCRLSKWETKVVATGGEPGSGLATMAVVVPSTPDGKHE